MKANNENVTMHNSRNARNIEILQIELSHWAHTKFMTLSCTELTNPTFSIPASSTYYLTVSSFLFNQSAFQQPLHATAGAGRQKRTFV